MLFDKIKLRILKKFIQVRIKCNLKINCKYKNLNLKFPFN